MTASQSTTFGSGGCNEAAAGADAPDCLALILTSRCNQDCTYCFQNAKKPASLSWDAARAGIDFSLAAGGPRIDIAITGGEPLLEFDLLCRTVDYVESLSPDRERIRYWLNTNGLLLSPPVAAFLHEHRFKVQLSFDGLAPAQNQREEDSFTILDPLLDSLREEHAELFREGLRISMMLTPATVGSLADSVGYFLGKGVGEMVLAPVLTSDPVWSAADTARLEAQMDRIVDLSLSHLDSTGGIPLLYLRSAAPGSDRPHSGRAPCRALRGKILALDVDGKVYRCPLFARSSQKFPAGSVMEKPDPFCFGDIRDPGFKERRAASLKQAPEMPAPDWENCGSSQGRCGDCSHYGECSICPVTIWSRANEANPKRIPDFICAFKRSVFRSRECFRKRRGWDNWLAG